MLAIATVPTCVYGVYLLVGWLVDQIDCLEKSREKTYEEQPLRKNAGMLRQVGGECLDDGGHCSCLYYVNCICVWSEG